MAAKKVAPPKKTVAKKVVPKPASVNKRIATKATSKTPPKVNVDAAQARYDALLAAMQTHGVHESRSWDAYWEAVDEVLSGKLYLLSPKPEEHMADGWCLAHTKQGADACRRNALVARFCSPDDELRYGVSKLFSVLRYIDKKVSPLPEQGALKLKLDTLRFTLVRSGKKVSVGIEDATVKEIDALANDRATGPKPSPLALPFERAFKKVRGFEESRFIVRDGQLSVRNIPLAHLETFMKLMRGVDWESALPK